MCVCVCVCVCVCGSNYEKQIRIPAVKIFEFNPSMKTCKKINFHILTFLANKLLKTYSKSAVIASALLAVIWFVVLNKWDHHAKYELKKWWVEIQCFQKRGDSDLEILLFHQKKLKNNLLVTQSMGSQSETTENITFCYLLPI